MIALNTMMIAAAFEIIAIIFALFWIYRVLCYDHKNSRNDSTIRREVEVMPEFVMEFPMEEMMPEGLTEFSWEEVRQATNDYNVDNLIGFGCYGHVYSGLIGDMPVVIKTGIGYRHPTFLSEVSYMSSKTQHRNVVKLVGYCYKEGEYEVLVYEYLIKGNLQDYLKEHAGLTFKQRVSVALGAAKGLQHLHNLSPPLQHKRFRTNKVMLDAYLNAKISDAGMSGFLQEIPVGRLIFDNDTGGSEETVDVYSFGLFLLELFTGEEPQELTSNNDIFLWIGELMYLDTLSDERTGTFKRESLISLMMIMMNCLIYPATERVNMDVVVTELEKIEQNEEVPLHMIILPEE
ncbi:PREDICTED: probable serine/threonine-protein kinase NAK [Camelina sativa]|uniref:Probable serine/threonine-protein kinase NAK n=1 Tax=Camelina sativa TaxID=90675 RepID=A0ABM0Z493_CAMSA|nr:PREDICTED: probable serine/threonine-protein kinase NAK [Camelina sativa]